METTFILKSVKKVIGVESIPSTQALARSLSAAETEGTLILACCQTAALDAHGKPFYAGEGGVYFTLILSSKANLSAQKLTLAMANAVSDVICKELGIKTKLSKNGEILCYDKSARLWKQAAAMVAEQAANGTWLLGTGIYLNNRLPVGLRAACVSLKSLLGAPNSNELFLESVLNNFWKEYAFL